jgi:hypothetical protein
MESKYYSEKSMNIYRNIQRYIPADISPHIHRCENFRPSVTEDCLMIFKAHQRLSRSNNSDLYSWGSWFVSRPGNRLSSLKYFVAVLSPTDESRYNAPKYDTTAAFHILSNSLFTNHPVIPIAVPLCEEIETSPKGLNSECSVPMWNQSPFMFEKSGRLPSKLRTEYRSLLTYVYCALLRGSVSKYVIKG